MKNSEILRNTYNALRISLIAEICILVKKHEDIEMEQDFKKPPFYSNGIDEQDENQVIVRVDEKKAFIMHQGNDMGDEFLEHLPTSTLINIVEQLEKSFEEAEEFLKE
ncbi:MAG: hypothetical protein AABY15_06740 [Nanoarchaeota archaeon]